MEQIPVSPQYRHIFDHEAPSFFPRYNFTPPLIEDHVHQWSLRLILNHDNQSSNAFYYPPRESEIYYTYRTPHEAVYPPQVSPTLQGLSGTVVLKNI